MTKHTAAALSAQARVEAFLYRVHCRHTAQSIRADAHAFAAR